MRALAVLAFAQACGGDGGLGTGPSGTAQVVVTSQGVQRAQLPQNCTGVVVITGPGMAEITVPIPADGRVIVTVPAGPQRTFTIVLTCQKTTGAGTFSGSETVDVVAGQPLNLSIRVAVNEPPIGSTSCSPPAIEVGGSTSCSCAARDPDPRDVLRLTWSATGGTLSPTSGPSTSFTSATPGVFLVTCAVSDGRATQSTTASVTVGMPKVTLTVIMDFLPGSPSTVTSSPAGISCAGTGLSGTITCSAAFPQGTVVTLTATEVSPGIFDGWMDSLCSVFETSPCTVTMNDAITVVTRWSVD